jgi:hypothetical protein
VTQLISSKIKTVVTVFLQQTIAEFFILPAVAMGNILLVEWLRCKSACLASVRPLVQTPVLKKKKKICDTGNILFGNHASNVKASGSLHFPGVKTESQEG